MDLTDTDSEQSFRAECRTWLEANVPAEPLPSGDTRDGFAQHVEWEKRLFADRWSVVSWPEAYGGRAASLWEWLIFEEEYYRAGAPERVTQNGIFLLAPTLFEFGTLEQRDELLPRMASADDLWCQGWSEPDAGSDLAGIKSRAVRDEAAGGWRISGQKTWTTRGAFCTHLFGLFRTDPDAERHHGLTYLLVPLDAEGITVRGVSRLDGDEGFAEVFFEDAFVPDTNVLGGVDQGWAVAMATTGSERGLTLRSPGRFTAAGERLVDLARRLGATGEARWRDELAQVWMDAEAYRLYTLRDVTDIVDGRSPGARSSLNKVWWSELDVSLHEAALGLLGPLAELSYDAPAAVDHGAWMKGYQFSLSGPIYAGTNEIQRNVIAERVLGLPRKQRQVRFAFTDDQLLFRDTVRDLLAKECQPEQVRYAWLDPDGRLPDVWSALAEMGVLGVRVPEAQGGLGLGDLDLVLLLEETGRVALPDPIVEVSAVAAPLLAELSDASGPGSAAASLAGRWLPAIAAGEAIVAVDLDGSPLVSHGGDAGLLLASRDGRLVAIPGEKVDATSQPSVDGSRSLATLGWSPVDETVLAEGDTAATAIARACDRGALGTAAQLLGLGQQLLDLTVAYVKERRQFGVPIGSFQAVKHHLADAALHLEFARPVVYAAAWSAATDQPDASRAASHAKAAASDAARFVGRQALQCHGAIGYTVEYDLHLWLKRVWALSAAWGDAAHHRQRVADALLGPYPEPDR